MENKCNGRCEECNLNQRTYCSAQMSYYAQRQIAELKAALIAMYRKDDDRIVVLRNEESRNDDVHENEEDEA